MESDVVFVESRFVEKEYLSPLSPFCPHILRQHPQIVHRVAIVTVTVCNMIRDTGNTHKHPSVCFLHPRREKHVGVRAVRVTSHLPYAWFIGSGLKMVSGSSAADNSKAVSEKLWRE